MVSIFFLVIVLIVRSVYIPFVPQGQNGEESASVMDRLMKKDALGYV